MFPMGPYSDAVCEGIKRQVAALLPSAPDLLLVVGPLDNGHNIGVGIALASGPRHAIKARRMMPMIIADDLMNWMAELPA
jgi:actin-like ATPase involved in cell morphogenesis